MRDSKPYHLLSDLDAYRGELPVSAQTYIDTFHEGSEDAKAYLSIRDKAYRTFIIFRYPCWALLVITRPVNIQLYQ